MTLNIYLTTVPITHQGRTRFLSGSPFVESPSPKILLQTQPIQGSAAIFRDDVWHDGEELVEGVKYLLRTDVMYEREENFDFERLYVELGNEEKGRKALQIAESLEDGGEAVDAVRFYKKAFQLWPKLERGE